MQQLSIFIRPMVLLITSSLLTACVMPEKLMPQEVQLTTDQTYNHNLDNNDNFSANDQWLVYDVRTNDTGIAGNARIEKVHVETGETVVLYQVANNQPFGPGVGAVSYSHAANKVVFIHGLKTVTADNPYQQWRRSGVIVDEANPTVTTAMDARDVSYPFTPGALRGGSHRHEWSGDGNWIGYTYNDAIMARLEQSSGERHNLRTIGVSTNSQPVTVDEDADGENISGAWFSALVVTVKADPTPGSDEISQASGDSWVGEGGYVNADGQRQRARGFIGVVKDMQGNNANEVFIVDIPQDITRAGSTGPLEGSQTTLPAPPAGAVQRRLTYTAASKYPGTEGNVRSSADGRRLTYLAYDSRGVRQIFSLSPRGGNPEQQTFHDSNVQSEARWHPDNQRISYVWDNSIISKVIGESSFTRLTSASEQAPFNLVWSHSGKMLAYNRMVESDNGVKWMQIFVVR